MTEAGPLSDHDSDPMSDVRSDLRSSPGRSRSVAGEPSAFLTEITTSMMETLKGTIEEQLKEAEAVNAKQHEETRRIMMEIQEKDYEQRNKQQKEFMLFLLQLFGKQSSIMPEQLPPFLQSAAQLSPAPAPTFGGQSSGSTPFIPPSATTFSGNPGTTPPTHPAPHGSIQQPGWQGSTKKAGR